VGKLLSDIDFEVALQPPVGDGRSEYSHNLVGALMVGPGGRGSERFWQIVFVVDGADRAFFEAGGPVAVARTQSTTRPDVRTVPA
jgi:hypothetical protein